MMSKYITNFNLDVKINKCDTYLCNKKYSNRINYEDKHILDVLSSFKNDNIQIIHIKHKLEHDGYDYYGPKSNIHYLWVYYKKGYDMFCSRYSREYWFHGEDDEGYDKW